MARRVVLVRHARIAAQLVGRLIGTTDVPLDAVGERQALALRERAGRWAPDRCYTSPSRRCRQTTAAMFPGGDVAVDDDLREIDFGRCEGLTFDESARDDPSFAASWAAMEPDFAFPGGESLGDFLCRVHRTADCLARQEATTVLAVTHKGVIRMMICHFLGLDPRQYVLFEVGYGAAATIELFDGKGVLASLEHLDLPEGDHG